MMETAPQIFEFDRENFRGKSQSPENIAEKELKDKLFAVIVNKQLFEDFSGALVDSGYSDGEIFEIEKSFDKLSMSDQSKVLSLPWELRERKLNMFREKLDKKSVSAEHIVKDLFNEAEENNFSLGYHLSGKYIEPNHTKKSVEWVIKGGELDDRDNMKMAYYSLDYSNLYREKGADNLYIVRVRNDHRVDINNHWGRAPKLSIVGVLDMRNIDEGVKNMYLDIETRNKSAA